MAAFGSQQIKLTVAGVALLAAGIIFYYNWSRPGPLRSEINFVCVATGQTFTIDRDKLRSIPMPNPKTGEATLLPCVERDGTVMIDSHYAAALRELDKEQKNKFVDPSTLVVRSP